MAPTQTAVRCEQTTTTGIQCQNVTKKADKNCGRHADTDSHPILATEINDAIQTVRFSDYDGVPGGMEPDRNEVSWWRALNHMPEDAAIAGPVRFTDGRHGVVYYDYDETNPRNYPDDLDAGIGTLAICGSLWQGVADSQSGGGRVDWWRHGKQGTNKQGLNWMVAEMNGTSSEPMDWADSPDIPEIPEIHAAVETYHERTGDLAFLLCVTRNSPSFDKLHIIKHNETPSWETPIGFAILGAAQENAFRGNCSDWDAAYRDLSYAIDIYNDWQDGSPVNATGAIFTSEPDEDPELIATGYYPYKELADVAKETLGAFG